MKFKKYQSIGNDFIILEKIKIEQKNIEKLCSRHFGVGGDGVLILHPIRDNSFKLEIYNSDGSSASMCGNGLKIVGSYLHSVYPNYSSFQITINQERYLIKVSDEVKVYLPLPRYVTNKKYPIYSIGNLHMLNENMSKEEQIALSKIFLNINISSYHFISDQEVYISTLESGVGFTKSCGSASLCLFKYLLDKGYPFKEIIIHSDGGNFKIILQDDHMILCGSPKLVFIGEINNEIFLNN